MPNVNGYAVYVVESTSKHFKIGVANDPHRRLKQLKRTQGPFEYDLIYYWVVSGRAEALYIESFLHKTFDAKRVNGEWFTLTAQDLIVLGNDLIPIAKSDYASARPPRS